MAEVTECQNPRAPSTLSEAVVRKKRRNLDFGSRVWYRAEVDCAGRTPFAEVLARKRCVGTAIDRPVERFAKAAAFCRRRRRRRNQKPGLPWPVVARDGDVRHIEQRNVFQSERGPFGDDPFIRIDDSPSESERPARPRPVAGCDDRILELVLAFLGSMRLLGCNKETRAHLATDIRKIPGFCFDIEAHMAGVELLFVANEFEPAVCRYNFGVVVVSDLVGGETHVAVRHDDIVLCVIDVFFPPLRAGCRDLDLVLLCPQNQENTKGKLNHSVSMPEVTSERVML